MIITITDEMVMMVLGILNKPQSEAHYYSRHLVRAALEAVAPLLIAQGMREVQGALEAMIAEKAEYMIINNLGDPEKQHTIKQARAALARAQEFDPK